MRGFKEQYSCRLVKSSTLVHGLIGKFTITHTSAVSVTTVTQVHVPLSST